MKKKVLITTGGGDCPGLNAVIRGIVKSANQSGEYEVWGSIGAFNGVFSDPQEIVQLTNDLIAGIHVKGGTIIKTTNKGNPLEYPTQLPDGTWTTVDRSQELVDKIHALALDLSA